jgi:hypothetical protein
MNRRFSGHQIAYGHALYKERMLPLVARTILATWMMPLLFSIFTALFLMGTPKSAQAQAPGTGIPQTLVILDFDVAPGLDPVLGRKAADALAVELKSSANYEVVPRQRVETVVATQSGLRAPFSPQTQVRLAQATQASGVISGRVLAAQVINRRSARVTVEARQLDALSGDVVNGAQISEVTTDKLQDVDNDILLDEAINKAAFAIVRAMSNVRLPEGTVLQTTRNDVELAIGAAEGVAVGQRYSVLRDVQNRATNTVERVKVAEVTISRVEADQSTATVSAGGDSGVRTGDRIRLIYTPRASYPVSATGSSDSLRLPPPSQRTSGNPIGKASRGLGGLAALALLVGLAGFGGGSKGGRADTSPPTGVRATPTYRGTDLIPTLTVSYSSGLPGVLAGENVLGYFIYRGESRGFSPSINNLHDFVLGQTTTYEDQQAADPVGETIFKQVLISSDVDTDDGGSGEDPTVSVSSAGAIDDLDDVDADDQDIFFQFPIVPATPGKQYFYRVQRVTSIVRPNNPGSTDQGGTDTDGGTDNSDDTGETRVAKLSEFSAPSGGVTGPARPTIQSISGAPNTNQPFSVTIATARPVDIPGGGVEDIDTVDVQVRIASQGGTAANPGTGNFVRRTFTFPSGLATAINDSGQVTLNFPQGIFIPNYQPGDEVLVRVGLRREDDVPGPANGFVFARGNTGTTNVAFEFSDSIAAAPSRAGSRSVRQGGAGQRGIGGSGLPGSFRSNGSRTGGVRRAPGSILRPR